MTSGSDKGTGFDKVKKAALTTRQWMHAASFAIAGLLVPNEAMGDSNIAGGIGLLAYAR